MLKAVLMMLVLGGLCGGLLGIASVKFHVEAITEQKKFLLCSPDITAAAADIPAAQVWLRQLRTDQEMS